MGFYFLHNLLSTYFIYVFIYLCNMYVFIYLETRQLCNLFICLFQLFSTFSSLSSSSVLFWALMLILYACVSLLHVCTMYLQCPWKPEEFISVELECALEEQPGLLKAKPCLRHLRLCSSRHIARLFANGICFIPSFFSYSVNTGIFQCSSFGQFLSLFNESLLTYRLYLYNM